MLPSRLILAVAPVGGSSFIKRLFRARPSPTFLSLVLSSLAPSELLDPSFNSHVCSWFPTIDRTMALSPTLPRSIQESAGSCSPSPTVRWPFANLFDSGLRDQISALKRCEQERQKLEYEIHRLDVPIERFDERLERLRVCPPFPSFSPPS